MINRKNYIDLIEKISLNIDHTMDKEYLLKALDTIYRISHLLRWTCKNEHLDWVEEINELYEFMKKY